MKVLIISESNVLGQALKIVMEQKEITVVICDHKEALSKFLTEEPEVVLVCDCEQEGAGEKNWQDITNSASEEKILRCGFSANEDLDYLQFPFKIEDLIERIK